MTLKKEQKARTLAVDFGLARIGLAISDMTKTIASLSLPNLQGSKNLEESAERLVSYIETLKAEKGYEIDEIVIGLPKTLAGGNSESTLRVLQFKDILAQKVPYTVHLFDERLTTVQADRSLREVGFRRKERAKHVDTISAMILLQTWLEMRSFSKNNQPQ